jgi:hypothetical protein
MTFFSDALDGVSAALTRTTDLALSPAYLPYTVGILLLIVVAFMNWRKSARASR